MILTWLNPKINYRKQTRSGRWLPGPRLFFLIKLSGSSGPSRGYLKTTPKYWHYSLALVGVSGSGKSTLVKAIVKFIDLDSGNITINQRDIGHIDKKALRRQITYVPQSPFIFTGTVLENLLMGAAPNLSQADILQALDQVQVLSDIQSMPQGLHSIISEDGGMSGGQKQRLAIARALLTKSPVLILDESTSSLDVLTEKKVIDNLMALDKTIIFVAHRLTIAERSKQVIVVNQGRIVETGTHKELIQKGGYYADLVNH